MFSLFRRRLVMSHVDKILGQVQELQSSLDMGAIALSNEEDRTEAAIEILVSKQATIQAKRAHVERVQRGLNTLLTA